ncbi:EI24 domain-containing protein [Micromonospora sp. NPDC048830]|uniref:EI24 domain-containing protein n=1 Tax=Micromonospora sp. NPDC048830 TaxID=3364257 RepID=UPI00371F67D8
MDPQPRPHPTGHPPLPYTPSPTYGVRPSVPVVPAPTPDGSAAPIPGASVVPGVDASVVPDAGASVVPGAGASVAPGASVTWDGAGPAAARIAGVAGQAVGAAGHQALRGVRTLGSGIGRFFIGVGYFFRGGKLFVTTPSLWALALAPVVLTGVALLGLHEATARLVEGLSNWLLGLVSGWPDAVLWILDQVLWIAANLLFHTAIAALTVPLTMLFGAAFFPLLTRAVVRRSGGTNQGAPPWYRSATVCLRQTLIITVALHVGWLIVLPLLWIPGVNVAAAFAGGLLFNGFLIGTLLLAVPLHHHGVCGASEQLRFAWRNLGFTLGFGVTSLCALILPVLSLRMLALLPISPVLAAPGIGLYLLTAPSALVGAVLLHQRIDAAGNTGAAPLAPRALTADAWTSSWTPAQPRPGSSPSRRTSPPGRSPA